MSRPLVSVILPAYNEEALLDNHVSRIVDYAQSVSSDYDFEILVVNDGSSDATGKIADELSDRFDVVRALHHPRNFGLGQVLKFGFANTRGDYVVTLDVDLSYDVRHIAELVEAIRDGHAKIVLASPYTKGGSIANVPFLRRTLSILGNRFLSLFVKGNFSTLTCLVRAYDGPFIRSLDLRSMGMDVMPETIYKSMVLRASIDEIPARLDWGPQLKYGANRTSSMRILRHILSTFLSGFAFRPFLFLVVPGLVVGAFACYVNVWMVIHYFESLQELRSSGLDYTFSDAFAAAFDEYPHTFITALLSAMLAIQLVGQGALALQNKRYFEDLFHLGSSALWQLRGSVNTGESDTDHIDKTKNE